MNDKAKKDGRPGTAVASRPENGGTSPKVALVADFGKFYVTPHKGGGFMKPIKAEMTLFERMGHLYKQGDKYLITAPGYRHLNKVASISIVTPQSVVVDGRPVPNPHIERNPRTRAIESVNIRKMGIGYSPAGNIVVVDKTLFYNVYTYFIQAIQAKMDRVKWTTGANNRRMKTDEKEYPDCAVYGTEKAKPSKAGSWAFFPTEPPLGIWVNYEDAAIIACLSEHTQRQRFGDRMATTIVERNILKDHPAIGAGQVYVSTPGSADIRATVTVYGYQTTNQPSDISSIMDQADSGGESKSFEHKAEVIDVEPEEERQAAAEVAQEEKGEAPPEDEDEETRALFNQDEGEAQ